MPRASRAPDSTSPSFARRGLGLVVLALGGATGALLVVQIVVWGDGGMDYAVPHACGGLECLHGTAEAPDGRVHCARFPPVDVKMSGASGAAWARNRVLGGMAAVSGLLFAGLAVVLGWRGLIGRSGRSTVRVTGLALATPPAALVGAILTRVFLWPLGFFSIG